MKHDEFCPASYHELKLCTEIYMPLYMIGKLSAWHHPSADACSEENTRNVTYFRTVSPLASVARAPTHHSDPVRCLRVGKCKRERQSRTNLSLSCGGGFHSFISVKVITQERRSCCVASFFVFVVALRWLEKV